MSKGSPPQIAPNGSRKAYIVSTGSYVPEKVLTNEDLEKMVETSNEWITTRTGIRERHIAAPEESASDLGTKAAEQALKRGGIEGADVEMIVVATITPDMPFPSTACLVQRNIGAKRALAFDIEAACSGFVYAIEIARQFVQSGAVANALVIGSEKLSSIIDWKDRNTCVLFGDGAGAALIMPNDSDSGSRILTSELGADGNKSKLLCMPGGGSKIPASEISLKSGDHFLKMDGKETFKNAIKAMTKAAKHVLKSSEVELEEIRWIIPHQANQRILTAVAEKTGADPSQLFMNVERFGNTSAASIGIALDELVQTGKLDRGDKILLLAFGAGLTWAAMVIEW